MPLRGNVLRVGMLACALLLAYGGLRGLGAGPFDGLGGDPPTWAASTLLFLFVVNAAIAIAVGRCGMTPGVTAGMIAGGVYTMLATLLLATFSFATHPPVSLAVAGVVGLAMAAMGVWTVDGVALRTWLSTRAHAVAAVLLASISIEPTAEAIDTAVYLLPLLWASGAGIGLAPLAALVGLRWLETTGVAVDHRLGVRLSAVGAGYYVAWREVIRVDDRAQLVRSGFAVAASVGLVLVLLAPVFGEIGNAGWTIRLCMNPTWAPPEYDVTWRALSFEWHNGCRSRRSAPNSGLVLAGSLLGTVGIAGEGLARLGQRAPASTPVE